MKATIVRRALLKTASEEVRYELKRIKPGIFQWDPPVGGNPLMDYPTPEEAIAHIRVTQESEWPDADLTIYPAADSPALRAAKEISAYLDRVTYFNGAHTDRFAIAINRNTHCDELLDALNDLAAYCVLRVGSSDPHLTPLLQRAIDVVESASGADLSNVRQMLAEGPRVRMT